MSDIEGPIGYVDMGEGRERRFINTPTEFWELFDEAPFIFHTCFVPLVAMVPERPEE